MAEEHQKPAPEASASTEEVVVVAPPEKPITENEPPPPAPEPEPEAPVKPVPVEIEKEKVEEDKPKAEEEGNITQSVSFKEETYVVAELPEVQKKALEELKQLIQEALNKHDFTAPPPPPPPPTPKEEEKKPPVEEEEPKTTEEESAAPKVEAESVVEAKEEAPKVVEESKVVEEEDVVAKVTPKVEPAEEIAVEAPVEVKEEVVAFAEVVETIDEDGAKTVEAIKETILVEVSAPPTTQTETETETEKEEPIKEEEEAEIPAPPPPAPEEVSIWGIPLLQDERSDVILLKFLRARDYKVKDAFAMIKNTVLWRKEFGIDALLEEDHGNDWDKVAFTHGYDKQGHPVCYNVFSEFQNKELYQNTFSTEEKRHKFLKWRIQFLEKSIRKLDFSPTGISSIVQVNDFKNSFGIGKRELWQATKLAVQLFQDNYPEFLAKQVLTSLPMTN